MNHHVASALVGKKIGFFGKGGSGKSTVTALLAHNLARQGLIVTVLDADSTNLGLDLALGIPAPPEPLIDFFGGAVFRGGSVTCPVDDPSRLEGRELQWSSLPETYKAVGSDGIRYLIAGKIGEQGVGAGCDGPVAKIARDLTLTDLDEVGTMLVDFKAGFEDSARGVITGIDWAVVVVDPSRAAIKMAADMQHMLTARSEGALPATKHLQEQSQVDLVNTLFREAKIRGMTVVLNRVESGETERYLREVLSQDGITPAVAIPSKSDIAAAWLHGATVHGSGSASHAIHILQEELEASLAEK